MAHINFSLDIVVTEEDIVKWFSKLKKGGLKIKKKEGEKR